MTRRLVGLVGPVAVAASAAPTNPAFDGKRVIVVEGGRVTVGNSLVAVRRGTRVRLEATSGGSIPGALEVGIEGSGLPLANGKAA